MRTLFLAVMIGALTPGVGLADPGLIGQYRLAEGPDVAGQLILTADGRFHYGLAAGALDEEAHGRWQALDSAICLYTEPKPVPPAFTRVPAATTGDREATLLVTWPNGRGIAGIDFRIGFDSGDPLEGYTQDYGWSMPEGDERVPRWIELSEPMHDIASPRFVLEPQDKGRLTVILTPNDLGIVDFEGACLEQRGDYVILHRKEGDMKFVKVGGAKNPP